MRRTCEGPRNGNRLHHYLETLLPKDVDRGGATIDRVNEQGLVITSPLRAMDSFEGKAFLRTSPGLV